MTAACVAQILSRQKMNQINIAPIVNFLLRFTLVLRLHNEYCANQTELFRRLQGYKRRLKVFTVKCIRSVLNHQPIPIMQEPKLLLLLRFQLLVLGPHIIESLKYLSMLAHTLLVFIYITTARCGKRIPLSQPISEIFTEKTEIIRLAENEKFTLPISTHSISFDLLYSPIDQDECEFAPPKIICNSLMQANLLTNPEDKIADLIVLRKKEKVFVADQSFNLVSYSTDKHFLLRSLSPRTSILNVAKISTISLVATEDEDHVYYITPTKYFVIRTDSLGSDIHKFEELSGGVVDVQKTIIFNGFLFLISKTSGLFVYRMHKQTRELILLQKIKKQKASLVDFQLDREGELLYVLDQISSGVQVYTFVLGYLSSNGIVLEPYDIISLLSITSQRNEQDKQKNKHIALQISTEREQQTLLILFQHRHRHAIAELKYKSFSKEYSFVRYYKFSSQINQILLTKDVLYVLGVDIIGIFPFGIHPKLIKEQFNGYMVMSPLEKIRAVNGNQFVGIHKNVISFATVVFENQGKLSCSIKENSTLTTIKFTANLTSCSNQDRVLYESYCAFQKSFLIQRMDLAVSAPLAESLWVAMLLFFILTAVGVCVLFILQKKKERAIRKMELYFQEKKHSEAPASSQRQGIQAN